MGTDPAQLLREHGLQVTAQRLAVLKAVSDHPHITAESVAEAVRAEIGAISRQAVYDALRQLTETHLIRRIEGTRSAAIYELRTGDNHHHAVCRVCGKTVDVACTLTEACRSAAAAESGFLIDEAEVIYRGVCRDCPGELPEAGERA